MRYLETCHSLPRDESILFIRMRVIHKMRCSTKIKELFSGRLIIFSMIQKDGRRIHFFVAADNNFIVEKWRLYHLSRLRWKSTKPSLFFSPPNEKGRIIGSDSLNRGWHTHRTIVKNFLWFLSLFFLSFFPNHLLSRRVKAFVLAEFWGGKVFQYAHSLPIKKKRRRNIRNPLT